ncbi:MAG: hypothetical protein SFU86_05830 [Pirellulaceae bacterium]|nr:hypothetical protein [Pirellulaceae bacterium]
MLHFQICITGEEDDTPLAVSFDAAYEALAALPRMFIEPDGSLVWRGTTAEGVAWQVDGNLIDRGDVLAYVELQGDCPVEQFDQFLQAFGWPAEKLAFQLSRSGNVLDEQQFRQQAASGDGAK